MMKMLVAVSLVVVAAGQAVAQELSAGDVAAIERAAVEYQAKSLPKGDIGIVPDITREGHRIKRDTARVQALTRALGARVVHEDSALTCGKNPSTCRLGVDALVRVGEPSATSDGAKVWVEVRRRSGVPNEPVSTGRREILLAKREGVWIVVGLGVRTTS